MTGVPVGAYKLVADGTTVPGGNRYPPLEYDIVTVAGQEIGVGLPIYLPVLDPVNRICVSETLGGTLTLPSVPGFSFSVQPGAATFPGGARSGCITVTPVHGDKVPMVPGFGQQPRFVVTIQPVGTHFNPPAQISFPNVDGLQPREVTEMYSYDHDLSTFIAIGTASVSDDGSVLRSDPGVGVMKAGWHCGGNPNPTGAAATCPACKKCSGTNCVPDTAKTTLNATQCCYNGSPIPKNGNDWATLQAKCPNRKQNDLLHNIDGCSLPWYATMVAAPSGMKDDPTAGVLGHGSTAFGKPEGVLPNGTGPTPLPCNNHDICYQTCGSVKANCDTGMLNDMLAVCQRAYPETTCPLTGFGIFACGQWYEERNNCLLSSGNYKLGLDWKGQDAFEGRKKEYCKCCD
jgi:hypothetical protein